MTLQQTVTIPADRRLVIKVPWEVPAGAAEITLSFKDAAAEPRPKTLVPIHVCHTLDEARSDAARKSTPEAREEFQRVMRETHGAWSANPWTDHLADVRAMRDDWDDHDPWSGAQAKRGQDVTETANE
jgi:hypothetical protein